ncbi:hypothetical protein HK104_005935 [Borealophlyctis nickersoniae]|nr:hypothetical protein HK104_005935 [Borealophlyctis nickersoniae]
MTTPTPTPAPFPTSSTDPSTTPTAPSSSASNPPTEFKLQLDFDFDLSFSTDGPSTDTTAAKKDKDLLTAVLGVIDQVNEETEQEKLRLLQEKQFVDEHVKRQKYLNRHSWQPFALGAAGGVARWG